MKIRYRPGLCLERNPARRVASSSGETKQMTKKSDVIFSRSRMNYFMCFQQFVPTILSHVLLAFH